MWFQIASCYHHDIWINYLLGELTWISFYNCLIIISNSSFSPLLSIFLPLLPGIPGQYLLGSAQLPEQWIKTRRAISTHLWSNLWTLHSLLWQSRLQYLKRGKHMLPLCSVFLFNTLLGGYFNTLLPSYLILLPGYFALCACFQLFPFRSLLIDVISGLLMLILIQNLNKYRDCNDLPTSPTRASCLCLNVWTRLPPVRSYPLCLAGILWFVKDTWTDLNIW